VHKIALGMEDNSIDDWVDEFDTEATMAKAVLQAQPGIKPIKNGPLLKYVLLRVALNSSKIGSDIFNKFCQICTKIQWDNTLADLVILHHGSMAPNREQGFGGTVSLFEVAGMTTTWSSLGCGERFHPCALVALKTLADLLDEEFNYVIIFKNTIEELEDSHDKHALVSPAKLEEHIITAQEGMVTNAYGADEMVNGKNLAYRIVKRLSAMEYIPAKDLITDDKMRKEYEDEMEKIQKQKDEEEAQMIRAREIAESNQDDEEDEEDQVKDPTAFDNWAEMMAKRLNPGEVTEHVSFEIDPMTIHKETQQGLILKKRFMEWKKGSSGEQDRNKLLFFRKEFDAKSFLAHVHKLTTEWDKGIKGLTAATKSNVEKQKDEMAKQFSRYSRCKSTMDQLSGDSLKNDIQRPLTDLQSEFRVAHEENRKSLQPIIEAQDNIEAQRKNLTTVRKFMGEFERLENIRNYITTKSWSHVVNEYKVQKRKGSTGKKFGKIAEVNSLIDSLLVEARDALLKDVLENYKIDATSVERKIHQLQDMEYKNEETGECAAQEWMHHAIKSVADELTKLEKQAAEDYGQVKEKERVDKKLVRETSPEPNTEMTPADLKVLAQNEEKLRDIETDAWLECMLAGKRFIKEISRVIEARLPLYNAVLRKLYTSHEDPDIKAKAKATVPELGELTEIYCNKFKSLFIKDPAGKGNYITEDKGVNDQVSEIQLFIVNSPRAILISFHGCAIDTAVIDKLSALHEYALQQHIRTIYDKAAKKLQYAHLQQNWVQDRDNLKITEMSLGVTREIQLMVDTVEALLSSQGRAACRGLVTKCGHNILELFKIFLDNIHYLAFGSSPAKDLLKQEHMRLLYLINDVRQCKSVKLHDVLNDFERRFDMKPDAAQKEELEAVAGKNQLVDCLEQLMLNRYVFLKAQSLNKMISDSVIPAESSTRCFAWDKNHDNTCDEEPYQVRSQVMEMLLSLVNVHSELYAHFAQHQRETRGPYVKGIMAIVDSIATAFTVSARMPDRYSQDGAWQFLVDVKFVNFVVDKYRSEYASHAFQDLENKFLGAAAAKGALRRKQVLETAERILRKTKEDTEHLFSCLSTRRDQEMARRII